MVFTALLPGRAWLNNHLVLGGVLVGSNPAPPLCHVSADRNDPEPTLRFGVFALAGAGVAFRAGWPGAHAATSSTVREVGIYANGTRYPNIPGSVPLGQQTGKIYTRRAA